jgi:hypothetical protein
MEDHQKKDHLIETHLEDHHLIHMLDFMDGKHLIQGYSCHHALLETTCGLNTTPDHPI